MKAKRIAGTILIIIGVILLLLQLFSIIGGGLPVMIEASTTGVLAYNIFVLSGFFLPGIIGLVFLVVGIVLRRKTNENVSVSPGTDKNIDDIEADTITPEKAIDVLLGIQAINTIKEIEANKKINPTTRTILILA